MTTKRTWTFALLAIALTVTLATSSLVLGKGKPPKDPPPEPDPPPVMYALQRFSMPAEYLGGTAGVPDVNDVGEVVGYFDHPTLAAAYLPYYLDIYSGDTVATNLNDIEFDAGPDPDLFPELDYRVPEGWYIDSAWDINNWGEIAGAIGRTDDPDYVRGCVIELRPDLADPDALPRLHLIPEPEAWTHTWCRWINDDGVVVGGDSDLRIPYAYHLGATDVQVIPEPMSVWNQDSHLTNPVNGDSTVVLEYLFPDEIRSYDVDSGTVSSTTAPYGSIRGFNDLGDFVGLYVPPKGKKVQKGYVFDGTFHLLDDMQYTIALNNDRDVIGQSPGNILERRNVLDHAVHGSISIDATIVADVDEKAIWDGSNPYITVLSERNATGFPVLAGLISPYDDVYSGDRDGFVLIPIPIPE